MYIGYSEEQEKLRLELRAYYEKLLTPEVREALSKEHGVGPRTREVRRQMYAMLKEEGAPPSGKWSELEALLPVRNFKARHASTLLTFDAVVDAIGQVEAKRGNPSSG